MVSEIIRNYGIRPEQCPKSLETMGLAPKMSEIIKNNGISL